MATYGKSGIVGLSKTEERLNIFDYSEPLYYDEAIISPGEAALNLELSKDDKLSRDQFSILKKRITRETI